jgi:hypothetical protein
MTMPGWLMMGLWLAAIVVLIAIAWEPLAERNARTKSEQTNEVFPVRGQAADPS